jgi:hypothetical protein
MSARQVYTRWERDRLGKLVLRQSTYRVIGRPYLLERGLAMRDAAMVTIATAAWFVAVLVIALQASGCAGALEQSDDTGRAWCCDATDANGNDALVCGIRHAASGDGCYCHGLVIGDMCLDPKPWTPGTFCTQANLVCLEST